MFVCVHNPLSHYRSVSLIAARDQGRADLCWQLLTKCSSICQTLLWLLKIAGGFPPFAVCVDSAGLGRIGCGLGGLGQGVCLQWPAVPWLCCQAKLGPWGMQRSRIRWLKGGGAERLPHLWADKKLKDSKEGRIRGVLEHKSAQSLLSKEKREKKVLSLCWTSERMAWSQWQLLRLHGTFEMPPFINTKSGTSGGM